MSTYMLVHGGDRDGSIWNNVSKLLKSHGHKVLCPSMTPIKETTLQHNIDEICELIQTHDLNNVILVGHSYGAMVIAGVLDKLPNSICYMVYIDSVVPKNGKSLFDMLAENGFNYHDFGLTPDKPCIEPLYFDERNVRKMPKAYIHCLKSEFIDATKPIYKSVIDNAEKDNWIYFALDTVHGCMFTQSKELAVILFGIQIFLNNGIHSYTQ